MLVLRMALLSDVAHGPHSRRRKGLAVLTMAQGLGPDSRRPSTWAVGRHEADASNAASNLSIRPASKKGGPFTGLPCPSRRRYLTRSPCSSSSRNSDQNPIP